MQKILFIAALLTMTGGVKAEPVTFISSPEQVRLIELYTSEGCSSCPPADAWLSGLKRDPGLWRDFVAVAFHVDYWDYLGWKDELARPEFSQRQREHKRLGGLNTVYTPGFVVSGKEWRGWFQNKALSAEKAAVVGRLTLTVEDDEYQASFEPASAVQPGLHLSVALLAPGRESAVKRGENRGRLLHHEFAVLDLHVNTTVGYRWQGCIKRNAAAGAVSAWVSYPGELRPVQVVGGPL